MLPRTARLRTPAEFSLVTRKGRRAAAGTVVVYLLGDCPPGGGADRARAGFVVSKKVGNSIVRHRVVRRLRAVVAPALTDLGDGAALVVRALPAAATATSTELRQDVGSALRRATGGRRR